MRVLLWFSVWVRIASANPTDFPADYVTSRARFRASCAAHVRGPRDFCRSFAVPSRKFDNLTVGAAYFTSGGRTLLILQSGTHGPEAYAGAAIQEMAMREHLDQLLARGIDVALIHALNPFGFTTGRRTDESNVNLNRNFLISGEKPKANPGYVKYRAMLEPGNPVRWFEYLNFDRRLLWAFARGGFEKRPINEAMNMGQYEYERGINFGGRGPTPQVKILESLLAPLMMGYQNVVFVDWHTGLGRRGTLHWMAGEGSTPALLNEMKPMLARLRPHGIEATVVAEDPDFFRTSGGVEVYAASLAPKSTRVIGATAEFGTMGVNLVGQFRSAHRLVVENQAWANGCVDPQVCEAVRRDYLDMFNPVDPLWRDGVLRQAKAFLIEFQSAFGTPGR